MDKFYEEFFKVCLIECYKTRELIKQESEQKRNLPKKMFTTVKHTWQTRIFQLETPAIIANKLDGCHCVSMKLVKETDSIILGL